MNKYILEKKIWSEEDFDKMGWHDNRIHAIQFWNDDKEWKHQIILDIDYIFAWVKIPLDNIYYSFWISPSTLIFEDVFDLKIEINQDTNRVEPLEIIEIKIEEKYKDKENKWAFKWEIELQEGFIKFISKGYKQFTRQAPKYSKSMYFEMEERNGINLKPIVFNE